MVRERKLNLRENRRDEIMRILSKIQYDIKIEKKSVINTYNTRKKKGIYPCANALFPVFS
jgi:peptide methionine sulfoxide reductase MsrB